VSELDRPTLEQNTAHVATGLGRLARQFRKPVVEAILTAYLAEVQAIEDAFWALLIISLDWNQGAHLDQIGRLVGEQRGGLGDLAYRSLVRARILANRSRGTFDDVREVLRATLNAISYGLDPVYPAALLAELATFPGTGLPPRIGVLVRRATAAGVGVALVSPAVAGDVFAFASGDDVETGDGGFADIDMSTGGALVGAY
jgi:hypothetical protein